MLQEEENLEREGRDLPASARAIAEVGEVTVTRLGGDIVWVLLGSVVLLIQTIVDCSRDQGVCTGNLAFGLVLAILSTLACAGFLILDKMDRITSSSHTYFTVVMFIAWIVGVCILTFWSPYLSPSNAYFAIWLALIYSAKLASERMERIKVLLVHYKQRAGEVKGLQLASLVVAIASLSPCTQSCTQQNAWALSAGIISFIAALVLQSKVSSDVRRYLTWFLVVWWLFGTIVCTFVGPFAETGNGYFATWACLIFSVSLLLPHQGEHSTETHEQDDSDIPLPQHHEDQFEGGVEV